MRKVRGLYILLCMAMIVWGGQVWGQPSGALPSEIAAQLRAIGPVLDSVAVGKLYAPLHSKSPRDGVKRANDLAYGPNERHRLDVYEPAERSAQPMPVLIFIHGGGFVAGNKSFPSSPFYDNIGYYFSRRGIVTVNATYRLAPQNPWPAGAQDVGAVVKWVRDNAGKYGGDSRRIFLMGHSAGAAHVAAYAFMKELQPKEGTGLAGIILVSGAYDPLLEDVARKTFTGGAPSKPNQAYYGTDTKLYAERSTLLNLAGPPIRSMIVYAELDMLMMQVEAGALFTALCRRGGECPELLWLRDHDHMSEVYAINTPDESLSKPVFDFITSQ
ncbi:MAG: alpha/beta hydrolase [Syntrophales bacterium LBB04]|nr:alpha/beta hydrolase [Syntrophales bacterium LBB04]